MRRLCVPGKRNVPKRLLLQAAACNLALVLRQILGAGTPPAWQERLADIFLSFSGLPRLQWRPSSRQPLNPAANRPAFLRFPHRAGE